MTKLPRTRILLGGLVIATSALVVACLVDDAFDDGRFACDPTGSAECPPSLVCARDGVCRANELAEVPDVLAPDVLDAAVPDAAVPVDACTTATWTSSPDGRAPAALAVTPDGRLFVGGTAGSSAWVAELDSCDGGVVRERVFIPSGTVDPAIQGVRATDTDLALSGVASDSRNGIFMRVAKNDLQVSGAQTFPGIGGYVGLDHIAITSDGAAVLGGVVDVFSATTQAGWVVRAGTSTCSSKPGASVGDVLAKSGGESLVLTSEPSPSSAFGLRRFSAACAELDKITLPLGSGISGFATGLAGDPTTPVVSGAYGPTSSPNDWGLLAQVNGTTWTLGPKLDPNPGLPDIIQRIAVSGGAVYVGLLQNASLTGGTPTIYRFGLPITGASQPEWVTAAFAGLLLPVHALATGLPSDDALYVAGTKPQSRSAGAIARCRRSTGCAR